MITFLIIFFTVLALIHGVLSFKKPEAAIGLILFLLPTYLIRFSVLGIPFTYLEILLLIFIGITILTRFKKEEFRAFRKLGIVNWVIVLFIFAGIISTLVSPDKIKALGVLKAFIVEPILFFYTILLTIKREELIKTPLNFLASSVTLISAFGFLQYWTFLFLPLRFWGSGEEVLRITSIFEYPNALALFLSPLFIFFLVLWFKKSVLINRWLLNITLLFSGLSIFLTFSRGAWLSIFLAAAFLLYKFYRPNKKIILASAIVIILFALLPPVSKRLLLTFNDASSFAHFDLVKVAANKIMSSPILGNGLWGFRHTLEQSKFTGEILNYPHNIILNFWLELGLLGLLSFFALINLSLAEYKKNPTALKLAGAMFLLVMLLHGLVDVPYFKNDLSILFWFVISLFFI